MNQPAFPFVSVIIPVYNDGIGLKRCLEALAQQNYPDDGYEVVVVDNGSASEEQIPDLVADFKQAVYAFETQPGSYAARNHGIRLAKGTILAFTDADCIPDRHWLEMGVKTLLNHPNCGFVAGKIDVSFENPAQPTAIELFESIWSLPQKEFVENNHFAATANMFTVATVMQQVGMFNGALKSSGDVEWGRRVHNAGYQPTYTDNACITHPARRSLKQLDSRARRVAGGRYDLQRSQPWLNRNLRLIYDLVKYLVAPIVMVGMNLVDDRLKTMPLKIQVSLVMFFVSYIYVWEMLRLKCGSSSHRG
jgi:glycosyltransferase involved in cell wall biosynthesis